VPDWIWAAKSVQAIAKFANTFHRGEQLLDWWAQKLSLIITTSADQTVFLFLDVMPRQPSAKQLITS
jgi:hypothetical protein